MQLLFKPTDVNTKAIEADTKPIQTAIREFQIKESLSPDVALF